MANLMSKSGIEVSEQHAHSASSSGYDFVVINTCTVKKTTEQKILDRLRKFDSMGSRLIVTGCMSGANIDLIEKAVPGASIITTSNVDRITEALSAAAEGKRVVFNENRLVNKAAFLAPQDSVIAKIPISDGCLSSCSFCETKHARSRLNSFSEELILKAIELNVMNGAKEIELTAQDTGAYGLERKTNIARLVKKASEIPGSFMIRVGMLNPEHLHRYMNELLEAYESEKVYKFIHLPMQSGSDKVLRDMKRMYTLAEYKQYVAAFRERFPDISIATDMIVGFPTETEADFEASMNAIAEIKPSVVNVSMFAQRPHASASKMRQLESRIVKKRSIAMSRQVRAMQAKRRAQRNGTMASVLVTEKNGSSYTGRDVAYNQIAIVSGKASLGKEFNARITGISGGCMLAVVD